jgi:hypothetical protein
MDMVARQICVQLTIGPCAGSAWFHWALFPSEVLYLFNCRVRGVFQNSMSSDMTSEEDSGCMLSVSVMLVCATIARVSASCR